MKIIVEGGDDKAFFEKIIAHLINDQKIDGIYKGKTSSFILTMGGKKQLLNSNNKKYATLSNQLENGKIKKVLFVFDCDFEEDDKDCNGMDNSEKCFEKLLSELNWDIDIKHHIFDKNLDCFLMTTIENAECYNKFYSLVECLKPNSIKKNKKPMANLYRDLYPYPEFDFKHGYFEEIKQKIITLFSP